MESRIFILTIVIAFGTRVMTQLPRYLFYYRDLYDHNNDVVVSSMTQLADIAGMPYNQVKHKLFAESIYYDKYGRFYIERVRHVKNERMVRRGHLR